MKKTLRKAKNFVHLFLAIVANAINLFPSRKLIVVGVTGTDGKTTTSQLIYQILRESGKRVAVISTIGAFIDGESYETGLHVTTPSPFTIQRYIKIAKEKGCTHLVLEVTSHALDQNRTWGIKFNIGVLTNITHEHLDYHMSYKRYVRAKLKLFKYSNISIINSNGEWLSDAVKVIPSDKMVTYSLHGNNSGDLSLMTMPFQITTKLIGDFNLENILAATATAHVLGIDDVVIDKAIQSFEAPVGRQQVFKSSKNANTIVDFAHTPNAFENILPEIRRRTTGKIIHVFGAAGQRDRGKRQAMGKVSSFYDDIIILTSEDPRSEKVSEINQQIKEGIGNNFVVSIDGKTTESKTVYEINDRKEAIDFAISISTKTDTVIITGKGHEKSMNYGHGEEPWSDQEVVKNYLKKHAV